MGTDVDVLGQLLRPARLPRRALRLQRYGPYRGARTYFEETRALHFHLVDHGKAVAIPLDGTGPSYAASFLDFDLENIRAIRHGDAFVEEETDLLRTVAHGSDGSRLFFYLHVRSR
jgi:hypothetical protein